MTLLAAALLLQAPPQETKAPFPYVRGQAYHVLPGTTSEESGYFSLCEGLDGRVYVGTAKYGENSFLVEFDPRSGKQRIVLDTNQVCGASGKGYASQAKLHTRNFVAPSGKIYVGSKQGYAKKGDTSEYPGGFAMVYDPASGKGENLGMPYAGQGVIDIVADESRGLVYVVTCEDQHWMLGDLKTRRYRELGPMLTRYAMTLLDRDGRAYALTRDFRLARYDPRDGKVAVEDVVVDGEVWKRPNDSAIPTWVLAPDGFTAYLILMNDARLVRIDLREPSKAKRLGTMVEGRHPDSRCALSLGPDGKVYAVVRVDNQTGFGSGYLHRLARYDPGTGTTRDLGVLAVKNPDFYDFSAQKPWSHGFHRLPDGTLTPLHAHMALVVARDGTAYVTVLYPYTLLKIEPGELR
jgi:outer membrane protein assembly factor BamB